MRPDEDPSKAFEWKATVESESSSSVSNPGLKKRTRTKIREIPEYYYLPRMSKLKGALFYGSFIAAGIGTGMLVEIWINKKIAEDGGVIWEFDKER